MTDAALQALARSAGVAPSWRDVFGQHHDVAPPTLRAVLHALGLPAATGADIADSRYRATAPHTALPPLITAQAGLRIELPVPPNRYSLTLEDGRIFDGYAEARLDGAAIPPILEPGYHQLQLGGGQTTLAVAPRQCFSVPDAIGAAKGWGLAVQLYALRRRGDAGIGDFAALAQLAPGAARHGAHAIAISPVHAQFCADPDRFSPYAPSSRIALNVLHAEIDTGHAALEALDLVDWPQATRFRLAQLRRIFAALRSDPAETAALQAFAATQGERLRAHARFEALHEHFFAQGSGPWHWRDWPAAFRDSASPAVAAFAGEHADEVALHTWLQFRADRGLAQAQAACRASGMGIGLISDLAVGTDSGGSQCWSRQEETLLGLTVGAPPDLLQRDGQDWGLTAFSPRGLAANGFGTYRDMLQVAFAHAGGVRIDHAMGLNRLWVIPEGASGAEGAYLAFPERDLLRLIALESWRHRAVVLAEDLGTVPDGFTDRLRDAGIDGMRVLWFERDQAQDFTSPAQWTPRAAAMTSTHDLPTLAGWWQGRDLDWRARLGQLPDPAPTYAERDRDRGRLWHAMQLSGAAHGEAPGPHDGARFADAACAHVGGSACEMVMLPAEDALALVEQPNLPGTLHEHPNWQRRLGRDVATLLDDEATAARLARLQAARNL
jgi:4-alpha-glucanotransferase